MKFILNFPVFNKISFNFFYKNSSKTKQNIYYIFKLIRKDGNKPLIHTFKSIIYKKPGKNEEKSKFSVSFDELIYIFLVFP